MTSATGSQKVPTNNRKGSLHCIQVKPITFSDLWKNYPSSDPCDATDENGGRKFKNQCAIRLSFSLKRSGVTFGSYPKGRKCWFHPDADHVLAAKELADWLELKPFVGCRRSENVTGPDWRQKVVDRTGIICFEDYYSDPNAGGDHIDLWNKTKLTGIGSGLRTRFGIVIPGIWSDFGKAKRIRFFSID